METNEGGGFSPNEELLNNNRHLLNVEVGDNHTSETPNEKSSEV